MWSKEVPFEEGAYCDFCGEEGAFDFMGDFVCGYCLPMMKEGGKCPTNSQNS